MCVGEGVQDIPGGKKTIHEVILELKIGKVCVRKHGSFVFELFWPVENVAHVSIRYVTRDETSGNTNYGTILVVSYVG